MRTSLAVILAAVSMLAPAQAQTETPVYAVTGVAADDTLTIRSGPGVNFSPVTQLKPGESGITITGDRVYKRREGDWVPVAFAGGQGWTRPKFLRRLPAAEAAAMAAATPAPAPAATTTARPETMAPPPENLPVAVAVPDVPGYVRTPWTVPQRVVDVRGLKEGTRVLCPFTQKAFKVPGGMDGPPPPVAKAQAAPPPGKGSAAPGKPALSDLPYGTPVAGRPGFVTSPYASKHQLVDVTGLPVGEGVKCPYSGKLFRVPPMP